MLVVRPRMFRQYFYIVFRGRTVESMNEGKQQAPSAPSSARFIFTVRSFLDPSYVLSSPTGRRAKSERDALLDLSVKIFASVKNY